MRIGGKDADADCTLAAIAVHNLANRDSPRQISFWLNTDSTQLKLVVQNA